MSRFVVIFLVLIAVAPLVPFLAERRLGLPGTDESADLRAEAGAETDPRVHRISRNRQGHFIADAYLNGRAVDMLVDTGATLTALPETLAEDIGIFLTPSDFRYPVRTANGIVYAAKAVIDGVRIGSIRLSGIDAMVLKDESLGEPLLGMSVLNELERFDMSGGTLVLVQ
jgi:aspartyl protease family protein